MQSNMRRSLAAFLCVWAGAALAAEAPAPEPDFWSRPNLLGDPFGLRASLAAKGIGLQVLETSEVLGTVSGGIRRGTVYEGVTQATLTVDLEKLAGWKGGSILVSALQIHGRGASANLVGAGLNTVSNFEATRATRRYDAYFEQKLFDGKFSVRIGQMRADDEFLLSQYGQNAGPDEPNGYSFASANPLFMNSTFGFPALLGNDLPSGGPAYPLAAPGVRLKLQPTGEISLLAAVFAGNPAGPGANDPQVRNGNGLFFSLRDSFFAIAEAQYALNQAPDGAGLPGTYRVGAWLHNGIFLDQRLGTDGLSLANPASNGAARRLRGFMGGYVGADQMIWKTGKTKDQGIGVFGRVMATQGDRAPVGFYINGGVTWKGPIPGRESDSLGLGVAHAALGNGARGLDQDAAAFAVGGLRPIRDGETVFELTYLFQATGWMTIQPDLQWIVRPGGGVPDPVSPTRAIGDALLIGLRTAITF